MIRDLDGMDIYGTIKLRLMWILKIVMLDMPYDRNSGYTQKHLCGSQHQKCFIGEKYQANKISNLSRAEICQGE